MATSRPIYAKPVDAHVRAALSEIESAERQMTGLKGGPKSSIERLAHRLEEVASELESSPNKKHPTWVAANERVDTLMIELARWNKTASTATH